MAGTFADQATLAGDNAFINKCRAAMIFRAVELVNSSTAQNLATLSKMDSIIRSAAGSAEVMARLIASGNATIAAASPAVPIDSDVQFAVNQFILQV